MKLQLKRSNVLVSGGAKEPTAAQLDYGELAINYSAGDAAIFLKDSTNNVIRIAGVHNIADDGLTNVPTTTSPPTTPTPEDGNLWYNSEDGRLYIYYVDANSSQWVDASPDTWQTTVIPDTTNPAHQAGTLDDRYINTNGDTMTGLLVLSGDPTADDQASNKKYVDDVAAAAVVNADAKYAEVAGDNFTGNVTLGTNKITLDATSGEAQFLGDIEANNFSNGTGLLLRESGVVYAKNAFSTLKPCFVAQNDTNNQTCTITNDGSIVIKDSFSGTTTKADAHILLDQSGSAVFQGNVGIGTSSPSRSLHIAGAGDTSLMLQTTNAVDNNEIWEIQVAGNASNHADLIVRSRTNAGTGGSEAMRITSSGNVGIGESSPVDLLHVKSSSGNANVRLTTGNTSTGYTALIFGDTSDTNTGAVQYYHGDNSLQFEVNNSERMRIDSAGRVGIGTSSMSSYSTYGNKLVVHGTGTGGPGITISSGTGDTGSLYFADGTNGNEAYRGSVAYAHSIDALIFSTVGADRMRIDSSGNVGMGAQNLANSSRLTLFEDTGNGQTLEIIAARSGGVGSQPGIKFTNNTGGNLGGIYGDVSSASVNLQTGGSVQLKIDSSGRMSGHAVIVERIFTLLYARLVNHGGCSVNGPGAAFTQFDSGDDSFDTVSRTTTTAPTGYQFIGDGYGNAFTFYVGCGDNVIFGTQNASNDAATYHSWVVIHNSFVAAASGLPLNTTRTSLP